MSMVGTKGEAVYGLRFQGEIRVRERGQGDHLWVDVAGNGAPVVLIHGLGATATVFEPVSERLLGSHKVIRFDLRGHGRSGRTDQPSVASWANDLDWLLDSIPAASADFVGIGLGTLILEHFVATRPDRVDRMVLVNPLHGMAEQHRARYRELAGSVRRDGLRVLLPQGDREFGSMPETPPTILRALRRELLLAQDPEEYAAACDAIAASYTSDLAHTTAPTLVMVGADATESKASAQAVAANVSSAEVVELHGLADWPTIEQPAQVADRIANFLAPGRINGAA